MAGLSVGEYLVSEALPLAIALVRDDRGYSLPEAAEILVSCNSCCPPARPQPPPPPSPPPPIFKSAHGSDGDVEILVCYSHAQKCSDMQNADKSRKDNLYG